MAGLEAVTAAFGRAETIVVGDHELSILLIKNPAGANEILRTLALEAGELDLLAILNDRTADGRTSRGSGTPTSSCSPRGCGRVTCAGTRAAELALRFKYAGVPDRAAARRCRACPTRSTRPSDAAPGRRLFVLPTYTALLELRDELAGRGYVAQFWQREAAPDDDVIWHDLECGAYAEDLGAVARARRAAAATRCSTSAPAPAASRSTSRARGHRVTALDRDAELLGGARRARRRPRGRARCAPTRATSSSQAVRALPGADADDPAARRARRARGVPALRAASPGRRRRARDRDRRDARALRGPGRRTGAAARHLRARRCRLLQPADGGPRGPASDSCSSGDARRSPRRASARASDDRDRARPADAGASSSTRAREAGLRPAGRQTIPATDDYVGSAVVMLGA